MGSRWRRGGEDVEGSWRMREEDKEGGGGGEEEEEEGRRRRKREGGGSGCGPEGGLPPCTFFSSSPFASTRLPGDLR